MTYQAFLCCFWVSSNMRICAHGLLEGAGGLSKYFPITQSYLRVRQQVLFRCVRKCTNRKRFLSGNGKILYVPGNRQTSLCAQRLLAKKPTYEQLWNEIVNWHIKLGDPNFSSQVWRSLPRWYPRLWPLTIYALQGLYTMRCPFTAAKQISSK